MANKNLIPTSVKWITMNLTNTINCTVPFTAASVEVIWITLSNPCKKLGTHQWQDDALKSMLVLHFRSQSSLSPRKGLLNAHRTFRFFSTRMWRKNNSCHCQVWHHSSESFSEPPDHSTAYRSSSLEECHRKPSNWWFLKRKQLYHI